MLYIKCLRDGISRLPKTDPEVRAYLEQRVKQNGLGEVYKELKAAILRLLLTFIRITDSG